MLPLILKINDNFQIFFFKKIQIFLLNQSLNAAKINVILSTFLLRNPKLLVNYYLLYIEHSNLLSTHPSICP